jgi:TfoX/Sxy family transcriptional regulator of competence genes
MVDSLGCSAILASPATLFDETTRMDPMACDEGLAERIRSVLDEQPGVSEKRMFGGVAFLVQGHMSVGIVQDKLMVRVGPDSYDRVLRERHARRMDFTGKPMKGFVYVVPEGYESDADLERWVNLGVSYVSSLPAKPASRTSGPPNKRTKMTRSTKARQRRPRR